MAGGPGLMGTPVRPDLQAFGAMVRERRTALGLSRSDLGARIGRHDCSIRYWEEGRNEPNDDCLVALAKNLDVAIATFARLLPKYQPVVACVTVGARIQFARWALGLTTGELIERGGLPTALRAWELDNDPVPPRQVLPLEAVLGPLGVPDPIPTAPKAGVIKWMGKKSTGLLPLIPTSGTYVEPYGGSAAILLAREPSSTEVYNDLHGDLANLFRTLQDEERATKLHHRLSLTLYSRAEYQRAIRVLDRSKSPDDRAWAFFVLVNMAFSGKELHVDSNWAPATRRSHLNTWWARVAWIGSWHERLAGVIIENHDALDVIRRYDSPATTFYLDPPYVRSTRNNKGKLYRLEMTAAHHGSLVASILDVDGAVVLSGYPNAAYEPLESAGWERLDLTKHGRAESVWRNPRALEMAA